MKKKKKNLWLHWSVFLNVYLFLGLYSLGMQLHSSGTHYAQAPFMFVDMIYTIPIIEMSTGKELIELKILHLSLHSPT